MLEKRSLSVEDRNHPSPDRCRFHIHHLRGVLFSLDLNYAKELGPNIAKPETAIYSSFPGTVTYKRIGSPDVDVPLGSCTLTCVGNSIECVSGEAGRIFEWDVNLRV